MARTQAVLPTVSYATVGASGAYGYRIAPLSYPHEFCNHLNCNEY